MDSVGLFDHKVATINDIFAARGGGGGARYDVAWCNNG